MIDQHRLASGSLDNSIKIWDTKKLACIKTLVGHQTGVRSIKKLTYNKIISCTLREIRLFGHREGHQHSDNKWA